MEMQDFEVEARNWLDGTPVINEDQMSAVDALAAKAKTIEKSLLAEKEVEYRPHKVAVDSVVADYAPDLKRLSDWLAGFKKLVNDFKVELRQKQDAEAAQAKRDADEASRLAQLAEMEVDAGNIESREAADAAALAARIMEQEAQRFAKGAVKGLRTRTVGRIDDYGLLINYIARNDKQAVRDFCDRWVASGINSGSISLQLEISGVRIEREKYAI